MTLENVEVEIECRGCSEIFPTSDPLAMFCDACVDKHLSASDRIFDDMDEVMA